MEDFLSESSVKADVYIAVIVLMDVKLYKYEIVGLNKQNSSA
jgi:hypothetical protein